MVNFDELRELIQILEESGLSEIEIEEKGRRIRLQKPGLPPAASAAVPPVAEPGVVDGAAAVTPSSSQSAQSSGEEEEDITGGLPTFDSPMVGTFYAAPSPGADPFVKVGDRVDEDQTVCIVEAMKLMNEVGAKFSGIIEKILVENAQPVEFGQPLFAVRPIE